MERQLIAPVKEYLASKMPNFPWEKFHRIDAIVNAELWHGPLGTEYWEKADPDPIYKYRGYEQAEKDLRELASLLPSEMWWDQDCGDFITEYDPEDDECNWGENGEWIGSESWVRFNVAEAIMYPESWKQVM